MNLQRDVNSDNGYVYKQVGDWNDDNRLNMNVREIIFPNLSEHFISECSSPCPFGFVKVAEIPSKYVVPIVINYLL